MTTTSAPAVAEPTLSLTTEHVGFTVSNLARSVAFYTAFLGSPPFFRGTEGRPYLSDITGYSGCTLQMAFFTLPGSTVVLELLQYGHPSGEAISMETCNPGIAHLCFVVADLQSEADRLQSLGATLRHERPVDRADGGRALYCRDFDGITIELQEPPR
jgi:lactoylglutathione lyase